MAYVRYINRYVIPINFNTRSIRVSGRVLGGPGRHLFRVRVPGACRPLYLQTDQKSGGCARIPAPSRHISGMGRIRPEAREGYGGGGTPSRPVLDLIVPFTPRSQLALRASALSVWSALSSIRAEFTNEKPRRAPPGFVPESAAIGPAPRSRSLSSKEEPRALKRYAC